MKELFIRIRILWKINNPIRYHIGDHTFNSTLLNKDLYIQNLLRIIELFENYTSADSYILRAEAYRELGRFDEAEKMLNHNFDRVMNMLFKK